jgi:hypothetical protein
MNREWLLLTATLPTSPSALRVRVWRALKATGAGTLRDGVYLLPATAPAAPDLWDIEKAIRQADAEAHMLVVKARDEAQERSFKDLFSRSELYKEWLQSLKDARKNIRKATEVELHKTLRSLEQQLRSIRASDFFPDGTGERASEALEALRLEVERHLSPGEPVARPEQVRKQPIARFQGKTWATRKRPWVDRLATAWLILRFVDSRARFVWIDGPSRSPKGAIGFDFDGATFTHVDGKVTFEVVAETFGLSDDQAFKALGDLVHYIDVGGIPVDEAAGVEAVVRGLQAQHEDDDALLAASLPLFDSLYAASRAQTMTAGDAGSSD